MQKIRFHPFQYSWCLRWGLVLCILPVLRALFSGGVGAAWPAFTQSAAILIAVCALAAALLLRSSITLADDQLTVRRGFLLFRTDSYPTSQICAVVTNRTIAGRLC